MQNSLSVFLASFGFVAFGYLSLVRLLSKQSFGHTSAKQFWTGVTTSQFFSNLGSSAFFVSLPATSLLIFWGWGPALLWLVIFHLVIESLCHLQYSSQTSGNSIADHLLRSSSPSLATIEQGLIQAFFLLSMAVVTALLATLIDRQSGLLFALLFLLPARALLRQPSTALPLALRIGGGLVLLALGLAFSNQLGFSIYGDWAPLGDSVSWLRFNNPTVIAAVLTVAVFQLEKDTGFKKDLSSFAGIIIVLLVIAMEVRIVWTQPVLDAPLNVGQVASDALPSFISLSLFIFAGFAALLIRLLNEEDNHLEPSPEQFGRLQAGSLVHLAFMLLLALSLAAALGIGAWKTHYVNWSDALNILDHLNLAISSSLSLIGTQSTSGTLMHTVLLAALCFTGFSFMLNCAVQLTVEEREKETLLSLVLESKILQAVLIFISATYFIGSGISISVWLLIGMLGWVLVTHLVLGMTLSSNHRGLPKAAFTVVALLLIALGSAQVAFIFIHWLLTANYLFAVYALALLVITALLWWRSITQLIQGFGQNSNEDLF